MTSTKLKFFENPKTRKSLFDLFIGSLVGPVFQSDLISLSILFLSHLQRTSIYLSATEKFFSIGEPFAETFFDFCSFPTDYFLFQFQNSSISIIVLTIPVILIILILTLTILVIFVQAWLKKGHKTLSKVLRIVGFTYQAIFFSIFQSILLGLSDASRQSDSILTNYGYEWLGTLAWIFLSFNVALSSLFVAFCYEPLHFTHDILAKRSRTGSTMLFIIKAGTTLALSLAPTQYRKGLISSILALPFELMLFWRFIQRLPYYNMKVLRLEGMFCYVNILIAILNIFMTFLSDSVTEGFVCMAVVLMIPLASKISMNMLQRKILSSTNEALLYQDNEDQAFLAFLVLENTIQEGSLVTKLQTESQLNSAQYFLMGLIKTHSLNCEAKRCVCKSYIEHDPNATVPLDREDLPVNVNEENILYGELMYSFKKDLLEQAINAFPKWYLMKLNLANFIAQKNYENRVKTLLLVYSVESKATSYILRTKASQIKQLIENEIKMEEEGKRWSQNTINIETFIHSHNFFETMVKRIRDQTQLHFSFWDKLEDSEPKLMDLLSIAKKAEEKFSQLRKLWKENRKKMDTNFTKAFLIYGLFLRMVKNVHEESNQLLKMIINHYVRNKTEGKYQNDKIEPSNMYDESNMIVRISLQKDRFAQVIAMSDNVADWFGTDADVIMSKNINNLMPKFIKRRHNDIIKRYLNTGKSTMINNNRKLYGLHTDGFLIPLYMYITPFPHIDQDYTILSILRPSRENEDTILITPDGTIQGITQNIAYELGIEQYLHMKKYNIVTYCPDFEKINNVLNYFTYILMKSQQNRVKVFEKSEHIFQAKAVKESQAFAEKSFENSSTHSLEGKNLNPGARPLIRKAMSNIAKQGPLRASSKLKKATLLVKLASGKKKTTLINSPSPLEPKKEPLVITEESDEEDRGKLMKNKGPPPVVPVVAPSAEPETIPEVGLLNFTAAVKQEEQQKKTKKKSRADSSPQNTPKSRKARDNDFTSAFQDMFGKNKDKEVEIENDNEDEEVRSVLVPKKKEAPQDGDFSPKRLPPAQVRPSMVARRSLLNRNSIFKKFAPLAKGSSDEQKAHLHEEYKEIYNRIIYQGQTMVFKSDPSSTRDLEQYSYFVRVHDERIYQDVLRVVTLISHEVKEKKKSFDGGDEKASSKESSEYDINNDNQSSSHSELTLEKGITTDVKNYALKYRLADKFGDQMIENLVDAASSDHGDGVRGTYGDRPPSPKKKKNVVKHHTHSIEEEDQDEDDEDDEYYVHKPNHLAKLYRKAAEELSLLEDAGEGVSTMTKKGRQYFDSRVEKGISSNQIASSVKFITRIIFFMFLAFGVFMGWLLYTTIQTVPQTKDIITLLGETYLRSAEVLEMERRTQQLNLTETGLMNVYTVTQILDAMDESTQITLQANNYLLSLLYILNADTKRAIYNLRIDVRSETNPLQALSYEERNSFDLIEEIIEQAEMLIQMKRDGSSDIVTENAVMNFIRENIINGVVLILEQIPPLETSYMNNLFTGVVNTNTVILAICVFIDAITLIQVVLSEKDFYVKKQRALRIWLTVTPREIQRTKRVLTQFMKLIDNAEAEGGTSSVMKSIVLQDISSSSQKKQMRTKEGNTKGLVKKTVIHILISTVVLLVFVIMLSILLLQNISLGNKLDAGVLNLQIAYSNFYKYGLSFDALYEYISDSAEGVILRQPVTSELETIFTSLQEANTLFLTLKNSQNSFTSKIQSFYSGNLCTDLFSGSSDCVSLAGGAATNGLTSIQSYLTAQLFSAKDRFDTSGKTATDIEQVLQYQSFAEADKLYSLYARQAFSMFTDVMEESIKDELAKAQTDSIKIIVIFLIVVNSGLMLAWQGIGKSMISERISIRRMLRMVSTSYIVANKTFRSVLIRDMGIGIKLPTQNT